MIKSEFTKAENLKKEVDFPVLAKAIVQDVIPKIVLFTSKKCGTCLWPQDADAKADLILIAAVIVLGLLAVASWIWG